MPAVACGAAECSLARLSSLPDRSARSVAVRVCAAARPCRGAALRVRASRALGETPAPSAVAVHAVQRRSVLLGAAGAALLLPAFGARAADVGVNPEPLGDGLMRYYGRATSSSSYGGYGGSDANYKYSFILPDSWKTDTVSKVEKATNGTDARFVDPRNREAKAYVTSFMGYPVLKEDRRGIVDDLSLSDSALQDALSYADNVEVVERMEDEQLYVDYDIVSGGRTIYVTITSDGARLYALFCNGATAATDAMFKTMRSSLRTIK